MYIHERDDWPRFHWDQEGLANQLAAVRHRQGRLIGRMEGLGFRLREEAVLSTLTQDVLKSSEIEGEILDIEQVRSSLARRLGLDIGALAPADRYVEGVVELMLDATQKYEEPLTEERLFGWHAALFPTGRSGMHRIRVGEWRDDHSGPMQVVSGPIGKERVHYEAPAASRLPAEMSQFLAWFNGPASIDPVLKAAESHLWFVTIHPFDDGNGRIARAIADLALARSERSPKRFYSMSAQIRLERGDYYDILEQTQKGYARYYDVDAMVLGLPRPRLRWGGGHVSGRASESSLLGIPCRAIVQRKAAENRKPPTRWVRGQVDLVQVGENCQVLAGYRQPRYQRPGQTRRAREECCRWPEHQLFAYGADWEDRTRFMIFSLTSGVSRCQAATSSDSVSSVQTSCNHRHPCSTQVLCGVTTCGIWDVGAIPASSEGHLSHVANGRIH